MSNNSQTFTIDDIVRNMEKVQNEIAKKESRIEMVNPLLIGACIGCGVPLIDKDDPSHMCADCKTSVHKSLYQLEKKKRKAMANNKKMSNKHVIHIGQLEPLGR